MNVGILGSGFGLYGYLPALLSIEGVDVFLPQRYASRVTGRDDTRFLEPKVCWVDGERELLLKCEAVVLAQRPADQLAKLSDVLGVSGIRALALEKPLAPTPALAARMLDDLEFAARRFRIGYTFRYTSWAQSLLSGLRNRVSNEGTLDINWTFCSHHHLTEAVNWKRRVSSGGGALRFYGIHLVALLAECGYDSVSTSTTSAPHLDEADTWCATFVGAGLPTCRVAVDCNAAPPAFSLRSQAVGIPTFALVDPFGQAEVDAPYDRRVNVVTRFCRDLLEGDELSCCWYRKAVELWALIESIDRFHSTSST